MSYTRLFDIIYHQQKTLNRSDAFAEKIDGKWKTYSTDETIAMVNQVSKAMINWGLQPNDKVAIISNNRPQWNFVDIGTLQVGAQDVPIYPTISPGEYKYIFNDAEIKLAFVADEDLFGKVSSIRSEVPSLKEIYTFDKVAGAKHWSEFLALASDDANAELEQRKNAVKADDLATLIYTSGTTGTPKGVMLSHNNVVANIHSTLDCLPIESGHKTLSFLPLCHIFERMVSYTYQAAGAGIYYAESMDTIGENLKEVQPHFFSTVPRLLEKVYDKIVNKGYDLEGFKKKLFFWALELGQEYEFEGKGALYNFKLGIANKLIFSKWREALGGNIKGIVTGASALQPRLGRVFTAGQIPVKEGYGLTETSPVLSFNRFDEGGTFFGSVGIPIPGVEVKLAEDGEILAKGPNIMQGYYKKPKETAEVIDSDGWFHTGDIGKWVGDKNQFLKIIDRKKELYKTSGGKYVAPQPLENKFKESIYIEQLMVVGNNQKFVSALICPNFDALDNFCEEHDLGRGSNEEMIEHEKVKALYNGICEEYNPDFSHVEQIKKVKILPVSFDVPTGELTPTMKLKRKVIREKFAKEIEALYN